MLIRRSQVNHNWSTRYIEKHAYEMVMHVLTRQLSYTALDFWYTRVGGACNIGE